MDHIDVDDIQQIAASAGAVVLENGGETYRAETTVVRTAASLGAVEPSSFITTTVVMVSFLDEKRNHYSYFKRIYKRDINLNKLAMINNLSRSLERHKRVPDVALIERRIMHIATAKEYSVAFIVASAALSTFFFTLLFGGTVLDALCALLIGGILRAAIRLLGKSTVNNFFVSLCAGSAASVMTDILGLTPLPLHSSVVIIGVLMQVVPGLALVNSIRDSIAGDFVAGTSRLVDALLTALALSVGSTAGLLVTHAIERIIKSVG